MRKDQDEHQVFTVARNTFEANEDGIVDYGQRNGDLRYNHLYLVDNPQFDSLLGYGPSAADPLTGEIIAADAYVYGAAIDTYAAYAADVIDLTNGTLHPNAFIEGENVSAAISALQAPQTPSQEALLAGVERMMEGGLLDRLGEVQARLKVVFKPAKPGVLLVSQCLMTTQMQLVSGTTKWPMPSSHASDVP